MLIKSNLELRKQRVFVNGVVSDELSLNAGVSQGSVLGPLLFSININDIADKLLGKLVYMQITINDTNRLEQIQLNAARTDTRLPNFASLRSLYYETVWENLADRIQIGKLTLMNKL